MRCFQSRPVQLCLWTPQLVASVLGAMLLAGNVVQPGYIFAQDKPASNAGSVQVAKAVGTIKSVEANSIVIASETGGDLTAALATSTKILRVPPGEKDLKNATALQLPDLQPGDRVLVRGQASADGHTLTALAVIVMKQADVTAKQQRERDDWQKRGVGGLVGKVDAATATITISSGGVRANKSVAVHIAKDTILRRYAPDSVKFDDAKPAPAGEGLTQIKVGDQLRARGDRSADGTEISAQEVVSGSFRNIAGTIKTIDASNQTMTVQDAIAKSAVVIKVSGDSQMKKLPAEVAQRIAMRLKGGAGGAGQPGGNGQNQGVGGGQSSAPNSGGMQTGSESPAGRAGGGGQGGNGPPDFQRLLSRLPNVTLADLQKGDVVMLVSTEGVDSGAVTAITLLAGVDAILRASPTTSLLSPWSLSASGGEGEGSQ